MTDLEISKALALAIGWKPEQMHTHIYGTGWAVSVIRHDDECVLRIFDYRDWAVAGPIAEKFDCFPMRSADKVIQEDDSFTFDIETGASSSADTPQKAIALAVIGSKK